MKKYQVILFDLDGTLLDFHQSSKKAFQKVFQLFSLPYSEELFSKYAAMNLSLWESYERGEITKEEIFERRFSDLFAELHWSADGHLVQIEYQKLLQKQADLIPHAKEVLEELAKKYTIYFVTNGERVTQQERLARTGLMNFAKDVFISDEIGYQKPDIRYFQYVFDHIPEKDKTTFLLIGDSLTSDMKGAQIAGIDGCFFSPTKQKSDVPVTYQISSLLELKKLL